MINIEFETNDLNVLKKKIAACEILATSPISVFALGEWEDKAGDLIFLDFTSGRITWVGKKWVRANLEHYEQALIKPIRGKFRIVA